MELISTHPVKKSDLGFHANLFGGKLLAWLDAAGAAFASQVCDTPRVVTIKIDECLFKRPAREGQLIKIYGNVVEIGNTSVTLYMEARAHNVYSGNQSVILSTNIKFVRVDENGDSIPISDRVRGKFKKQMLITLWITQYLYMMKKTKNTLQKTEFTIQEVWQAMRGNVHKSKKQYTRKAKHKKNLQFTLHGQ